MKLQILVNHYKEPEPIISRFLSSLEMQKGVDFDVIIYTDGGTQINNDFLKQFNLSITYKYLSHTGICHTRNQLLDASTADYIMFCDIDDCFSSSDGLLVLKSIAEETKADIIGSPYLVERLENDKYTYDVYEKDIIRVHGKIFKRQYLIDNNIRFPDELYSSGDMKFLWLCYALTNNFIWAQNNFYIWKYNLNSITRSDEAARVRLYERTIKCYTLLAHEVEERGLTELYDGLIASTISMLYLDSTSSKWANMSNIALQKINKAIYIYLKEFYEYYQSLDPILARIRYDIMKQYKPMYKVSGDFKNINDWAIKLLNKKDIKEVVILGCGIVGNNLKQKLNILNPELYDKYKDIDTRTANKYNFAFICIDTPQTEENLCDITEIQNAILEQEADIYIIKSTILPGTIERLKQLTNKHIIFSPEYYGNTQHCNNYDFNYTILGGEQKDCYQVVQLLQKVYDGRHQFRVTDSKTAELVKYMENSYLATKVSFCQQFYRVAKQLGISYEELRELFILDPRVNPSHTFIYDDKPYWDSHCLNKDVAAIAEEYDMQLLKDVINFNELCKIENK